MAVDKGIGSIGKTITKSAPKAPAKTYTPLVLPKTIDKVTHIYEPVKPVVVAPKAPAQTTSPSLPGNGGKFIKGSNVYLPSGNDLYILTPGGGGGGGGGGLPGSGTGIWGMGGQYYSDGWIGEDGYIWTPRGNTGNVPVRNQSDPYNSPPSNLKWPETGPLTSGGGSSGGYYPPAPESAPAPKSAPAPEETKPITWSEEGYTLQGGHAPSWWRPMVPSEVNENTAYGAMLNALIPYLSPEDQVRVGHQLYGMFDTELSRYKPGYIPEVVSLTDEQAEYMKAQGRPMSEFSPVSKPVTLNTGETIMTSEKRYETMNEDMKRYLGSSQRAADAIATLSNMREKMVGGNREKLGPGYKWLQNVIGAQVPLGAQGQSGQSRLDYEAMMGAMDPFLSQASAGELAAFGPLGQAYARPYFRAGQVKPFASGRYGTPNLRYF